MSVINTNMSAIIATNAIIANDRAQETAMERLSTGLRINSAGDDAAGLAISMRMAAEVSGLQMATRNANDAISMLETAEGATREVSTALQRMRELAVQAASDTYSVRDRRALDLEYGQLMLEIQRIATQTTWNTKTLLNGANDLTTRLVTNTTLDIQLGKGGNESMNVQIRSFDPRTAIRLNAVLEAVDLNTGLAVAGRSHNLPDLPGRPVSNTGQGGAHEATGVTTQRGVVKSGNDNHNSNMLGNRDTSDLETQAFGHAVLWVGDNAAGAGNRGAVGSNTAQRLNLTTRINASYALTNLDIAITAVSAERARYGAYIARFESAGDNLTNVARHQESSRSRIADADYAIETSELSRTTIIAQASTAMLAQANAAKQTVLTLLQ
jgi:flagellin